MMPVKKHIYTVMVPIHHLFDKVLDIWKEHNVKADFVIFLTLVAQKFPDGQYCIYFVHRCCELVSITIRAQCVTVIQVLICFGWATDYLRKVYEFHGRTKKTSRNFYVETSSCLLQIQKLILTVRLRFYWITILCTVTYQMV